jgi:hypothetical protein
MLLADAAGAGGRGWRRRRRASWGWSSCLAACSSRARCSPPSPSLPPIEERETDSQICEQFAIGVCRGLARMPRGELQSRDLRARPPMRRRRRAPATRATARARERGSEGGTEDRRTRVEWRRLLARIMSSNSAFGRADF